MSKERFMKKLENIPKKNIYEVPEGYFDKLPGMIQARIEKENPRSHFLFTWGTTLKYALPVVIIFVIGLIWFNQSDDKKGDFNSILATIETEDLVAYIGESDITTDELLDAALLDMQDAADIEDEVYGDVYDEDLDALIEEFDIDLNNL